jgi:sugar transferase (PEP-CTERM/EpsH1 system associated)
VSAVVGNGEPLLFLTHRVPFPPDKGDRIRTFHVLRHLSRQGPVDLACLADEPPAPGTQEALGALCRRVGIVAHGSRARWVRAAGSVLAGGSLSEGFFWSAEMARQLRTWATSEKYAGVVASASSLAAYLDLPGIAGVPVVVDLMDVDSQKWRDYADKCRGLRRLTYRVEAARVRRLERRLADRARALVVVSEAEADLLRAVCPAGDVRVVPNGVDLDYFRPAGQGAVSGCVFVGALDYWPNVDAASWFCKEVWPQVRSRCPGAVVRLVGRRPTDEVRRLGAIDGVEVVGQVPDVRPFVWRSAVAVAPLRIARGVQNKVLEGMAMGLPVVASPQALQGLGNREGLPVLEARTGGDWVETLASLFADATRRRELGVAGREYVERRHAWSSCLAPLGGLLSGSPAAAAVTME